MESDSASLDIFSHNITQQITKEGRLHRYNSNSAFIIESKEFAEFQKVS